ncbi:mediator complex subunit [Kluyveromyces marxianus]|nr:mediator complex subunit [Kluyveromyces marxianus]KAG0683737.1 mediator complex subunit [Kluyveromyces marxianus]QGN16828.1 protein SRB6 [Kluyveromyces marxianus]
MSNQVLLDKLDRTTETLSHTLVQIVKLSDLEFGGKDTEQPRSNSGLVTVSSAGVQMTNNYTMQLIKGIQDLLVITRTIREKWVLSQLPENEESSMFESEETLENCKNLIQQAMDTLREDIS